MRYVLTATQPDEDRPQAVRHPRRGLLGELPQPRARGLHQPDLPGHFEWEHSEAFVRGLAERGFNLYITQFAKVSP